MPGRADERGAGRRGALHVFDPLRGRRVLGQMTRRLPATAFWRRVIGDDSGGRGVGHEWHHERQDGLLPCFDNSGQAQNRAA